MKHHHLLLPLGGLLLASVTAQDPRFAKPAPQPLPHTPDWKTGPAEPWVPPVEVPHVRQAGSAKPAPVPTGGTGIDLFADGTLLLHDTPRPGLECVAAAGYKAEFSEGVATFVPFLGSDAPTNRPIEFELVRVDLAGEALPVLRGTTPQRTADAIEFHQGALVSRYEAHVDGLAQSFRFDALPVRGALELRIEVRTGLEARLDGSSLRFAGPEGGVDYGAAFAIDARGRRIELDRTWSDGSILITVPSVFVESAALPLLVDPLVSSYLSIATFSRDLAGTDVTFDDTTQRFMVCAEYLFSATDSDVYSYAIDAAGNLVAGSTAVVDSSVRSWQAPRIANNSIADRNLVVAQVSSAHVSPFSIEGRVRDSSSLVMGNQFVVSAPGSPNVGDKIRPDVGGDPHIIAPTYFGVIWERVYSTTDHDVHSRLVTAELNPALIGSSEIMIDNSGLNERAPQISNSVGAPVPHAGVQKWMIVYERAVQNHEIRARTMRWDGALDPSFVIASGDVLRNFPSVSTMTNPDAQGNYLYLVAWEKGFILDGGDTNDIEVALCSQAGALVSPIRNLQTLENSGAAQSWDQFRPRVAGDGCRFVVTYAEDWANSGDIDVRLTTLHPFRVRSGSYDLGVTESRAWAASYTTVERHQGICSVFESLDTDNSLSQFPITRSVRYGLSWAEGLGTSSASLRFNRYDGMTPSGGFSTVATGCGFASLAWGGIPALTEQITLTTNGQAILVGTPQAPLAVCTGCQLGVNAFATVPPSVAYIVPCDSALIGGTLAFQGIKLGTAEVCFRNTISLSDTLLVTIR